MFDSVGVTSDPFANENLGCLCILGLTLGSSTNVDLLPPPFQVKEMNEMRKGLNA